MTRNGRMLKASIIAALVGVLGLVAIDRACPEEVAVSVGGTVSAGLGESAYSPLARVSASAGRLELAGSFDYSHKVESGRGWIGGIDVELRALSWLLVGADFRHRDGGTWAKDVGFIRVGLPFGANRLVYRHEVLMGSAPSNHVRALELIGRRDIGSGFFLRASLSGVTSQDYAGARHYGTYSQVALGRAWRGR